MKRQCGWLRSGVIDVDVAIGKYRPESGRESMGKCLRCVGRVNPQQRFTQNAEGRVVQSRHIEEG